MTTSFTSFLICVVTSNLLVLFLCLLIRFSNHAICISPHYLVSMTVFILLRLCLPYEFFYSLTIPSSRLLPFFQQIGNYRIPVFNLEIYKILVVIWLGGALIRLYNICRKQYYILKVINNLPNSPNMAMLRDILKKENIKKRISLIEVPGIVTPAIIGTWNPKIIVPYKISKKELYFVLLHEVEHYKKRDIYLISALQLLCCIYWWNPFFYIFKAITENAIELRIDSEVVKKLNFCEQLDYLQSILNVAKRHVEVDKNMHSDVGTVEKDSNLNKRFENVLNKKNNDLGKWTFGILLILVFASTTIIIEPYSIAPKDRKGTFSIPTNSYLIKKENLYELYIDGNYRFTVDSTKGFDDFPVYDYEEEKENENEERKKNYNMFGNSFHDWIGNE